VDLENNTASPSQVAVNAVVVPLANPGQHYDGTPGTYLDLAKASWLIDNFNTGIDPLAVNGDAVRGAALQAAIWNVIDGDADFNVTTGIFSISTDGTGNFAAIVADANLYLAALSAALGQGGTNGQDSGVLYQIDRTVAGFQKPNGQDMLGGAGSFHTNASPATPEGASLLMFLPGLIPVAVGLRRRRNKSVGK